MDLKGFFNLNKNEERKKWEFTPNEKVNSTSYTVAFYEADNEEDAWITLFMAVQKSPEFLVEEDGDWCNDCLENPSRVITK